MLISGGKRNEKLILPVNDSISGTLSADELCAKTTISAQPSFSEDKMWLNGAEVSIWENERLKHCIEHCKYKRNIIFLSFVVTFSFSNIFTFY